MTEVGADLQGECDHVRFQLAWQMAGEEHALICQPTLVADRVEGLHDLLPVDRADEGQVVRVACAMVVCDGGRDETVGQLLDLRPQVECAHVGMACVEAGSDMALRQGVDDGAQLIGRRDLVLSFHVLDSQDGG